MKPMRVRWVLIVLVAVCPIAPPVGHSGPVFPESTSLSDSELTLAGITEVRLEINPLTKHLRGIGVTKKRIAVRWIQALQTANIKVVNDNPDAPILRLETKSTVDDKVHDATAFAAYLTVLQSVYVKRIDRTALVPTYVYVMGGLDRNAFMAETANAAFNILVNRFIRRVEMATAALEQ